MEVADLLPVLTGAGGAGAVGLAARAAIHRIYVDIQGDRKRVMDHLREVHNELVECREERGAFKALLDDREKRRRK